MKTLRYLLAQTANELSGSVPEEITKHPAVTLRVQKGANAQPNFDSAKPFNRGFDLGVANPDIQLGQTKVPPTEAQRVLTISHDPSG